jgi:N-acetyl-gamma-glutamyl-phosphate reductase
VHIYPDVTTPPRIAVVGATGYSGQELLKILARHPGVRLTGAFGSGASDQPRRLPALARRWDGLVEPFDHDRVAASADAVFLSLPEATSAALAPPLVAAGLRVVDLSGAFRLADAKARQRWYPQSPEVFPPGTVYGLAERDADALRGARLVSCPGCYPTATLLALAPLVDAGLLAEGDIVVDAKSGISGAGKAPSERTHFSENHGSVAAYGVFSHRHGAEIEQQLGRTVTFVPHLVPLDRGILATIYTRVRPATSTADVEAAYARAYAQAPFVRLTGDALPEIKHVAYSNFCDLGWRLEPGGTRLVVVSCLDNLLKGAASQAVQNYNVAAGLDETAGLA